MTATRIAFLGLGAIGAPMARHLARDHDLTVWNRTPEKAEAFARETGATFAASPADACRAMDVIVTCLPSSREVEALFSDGTLLESLGAGMIWVDCTSGDPATSKRLSEQLGARGVSFIDAPVSGGVSGAVEGVLTVMVGGDSAVLEKVRHVLQSFGKRIVHCGPIGSGDAVKAVNNALLAMHVWGTAEGLVALEKAGVSSALALEVINASSGRSNASMNLFPERVLTRAFPRTFKLALLDKDVGIAADFAREQGVPAPMLELTSKLFRSAHAELGEDADHVEAVLMVERTAGQQIGASK